MSKIFGNRKIYMIISDVDWDGRELHVRDIFLSRNKAETRLQNLYAKEYAEMFEDDYDRDDWVVDIDCSDNIGGPTSSPKNSFYIYDNDWRHINVWIQEKTITT